jgi:endonuclease/exonuclease/phosphatase family metal-dependent hydrolase
MRFALLLSLSAVLTLRLSAYGSGVAEVFRVATYNLEGYLDATSGTRQKKSQESKAKIRETIRSLNPDVLALQELGTLTALLELRDSLKAEGLDLPNWEYVSGSDTNIHIAVLSRYPFIARHAYTNENYLLSGRRFHVSRGFAELAIQVSPSYSFTLLCAHLKSKRATPQADEAEMRAEEARLLREKIEAHLASNPESNLVVLGDFNDTKDAVSTKILLGRGKLKLVDTCPAERNGDSLEALNHPTEARNVTWTLYYNKDDTFSRVDYILLSRGMAREWLPQETYVATIPDWGLASDHRPLVAGFEAVDK